MNLIPSKSLYNFYHFRRCDINDLYLLLKYLVDNMDEYISKMEQMRSQGVMYNVHEAMNTEAVSTESVSTIISC